MQRSKYTISGSILGVPISKTACTSKNCCIPCSTPWIVASTKRHHKGLMQLWHRCSMMAEKTGLKKKGLVRRSHCSLCKEKTQTNVVRAWTAQGAVQVSSSRSPAKFTNYEKLQHKLRVQSQPPAKDLFTNLQACRNRMETMAKKVKFETPGLQHSVGLNWRQAA